MAKFIYRGFNPRGDMISSQPFAITGANLRKSQKKTAKAGTKRLIKSRSACCKDDSTI